MSHPDSEFSRWDILRRAWPVLLAAVLIGTSLSRDRWLPPLHSAVRTAIASLRSESTIGHEHSHDGGSDGDSDHDHAGHDHAGHSHGADAAPDLLKLSASARRSLGLNDESVRPIRLQTYRRTITVPAVIAEKPGRTRVEVATPMTGAVTGILAVEGEAVLSGDLLFRIRLTHEDLVQAQTAFVQTLGELDVERREIQRLEEITRTGAVAGKLLLEREYAAGRLTALLRAQREALRLHGLSELQVDRISETRRLLRELQMFAPAADQSEGSPLHLTRTPIHATGWQPNRRQARPVTERESESADVPMVVQRLNVHVGQSVQAGDRLCSLTDLSALYVEGMAFEQDVGLLRHALQNGWNVNAVISRGDDESIIVEDLPFVRLASEIDPESRTLAFYVDLPNEIVSDRTSGGHRFVEWRYVPGQRLELRIPVEEWSDCIVLPVQAVAGEGAESFVFQKQNSGFRRIAVHEKYRDQFSVVIASDGALEPGDVVAMTGAHQMQMALRNQAGGGPDPHAGHNH